MNTTPKISIITPVFNMERYLDQCIQSVIAQTFTDWELLLVNDGSTDRSAEICDRYAALDHRIKVIHKENTGVSDSRNIAIGQARAELLGFVDADDWIEPNMYEILYNDIIDNQADISLVGFSWDRINRSEPNVNAPDTLSILTRDESLEAIYHDKMIRSYLWDKLWKKSMITQPFPVGLFYEDYATVIKWMANANKVTLRTRPLYHYRMRRGSTVNGVHPVRRIHFVLAEIERAKFLQSIGYTPQGGFSGKILRSAVTMAKLIARGVDSKDEALHHISQICEIIKPYLPADENSLGHKTYSRLQKMLHSPRQFVRNVRFSRLFMFSSKRKEKHLYP